MWVIRGAAGECFYALDYFFQRSEKSEYDRLSESTPYAFWFLMNVSVQCGMSFSYAARCSNAELQVSDLLLTLIMDPPVLCRGFIYVIIIELMWAVCVILDWDRFNSPVRESQTNYFQSSIQDLPNMGKHDVKGDSSGACETSEQAETNHQRILRNICSFLLEPQFVPQHVNVWLSTGSDSFQKLWENKADYL